MATEDNFIVAIELTAPFRWLPSLKSLQPPSFAKAALTM